MPTSISSISALLVGLLGWCASGAAMDAVPEIPPPKSWDKFVMLMYQAGTDATKDQALYESVNLHGLHIDRKNDALLALAKQTGWPFYVDHAADKGFLHLGDNTNNPNVKAVVRQRGLIVRPNSLADPTTIEKLHNFLKERISAAKGSSVIGYSFDDEISLGDFCSPAEVDGHPLSIAFYQKQLKAQYLTIDKLNQQYGTNFTDFASIKPTIFEQVRGQLAKDNIAKLNLSAWCDWRSAMDTQFAEVLAELTRFSNGIDNTVPAGFVGGQAPNAWGGYDWRKLSKAVQWTETYDIGGSNEILRSFWTQKRAHVQTYFSSKNPHMDAWFLWYYLCQGNRGVIVWPEGWFQDGKVADHIKALADTFKEVQGAVSQKIIDGEFQHDPVALYYSQPSIQLSWALDAACHGGSWANRLSSMDNGISTGGLSRLGWLKSLQDLGVQPTFIHMDQLLDGALKKEGFKILVLNRALCLSDAEVAAIRLFAKAGGTVIADHLCAIFDEHGKARPAGALDDLFGVKRDLGKGWLSGNELTEVNGEQGGELSANNWAKDAPRHLEMAVFERGLSTSDKAKSEQVGGTSIVVRNGKAIYLNLSPIGYLMHRSDDAGKAWLDLISALIKDAGVEPRVILSSEGRPAKLIEALFWKNGKRTTVCVVKNIDRAATINSFGDTKGGIGDEKMKLKIQFAKPVKDLKNERTGKDLGNGAVFEDEFLPWEANVYSYAN